MTTDFSGLKYLNLRANNLTKVEEIENTMRCAVTMQRDRAFLGMSGLAEIVTDAALGDVDMRRNLQFIGYVVSENAAASEKCVASGVFQFPNRYLSLVVYNAAGASVNATDSSVP